MSKFISSTTTCKQNSIQSAHKQTSIPPQNVNIVPPKRHQKAHSASSSESTTYVLTKLSLTNEVENYRVSHRNAVKDAPHCKVMRIAFSQFHVTQSFNRKNRNPARLTD